jgi:hypothetical protein
MTDDRYQDRHESFLRPMTGNRPIWVAWLSKSDDQCPWRNGHVTIGGLSTTVTAFPESKIGRRNEPLDLSTYVRTYQGLRTSPNVQIWAWSSHFCIFPHTPGNYVPISLSPWQTSFHFLFSWTAQIWCCLHPWSAFSLSSWRILPQILTNDIASIQVDAQGGKCWCQQ